MQGGATRFDVLNLAVQPQKGKALLFFPSFADGTSDPRCARHHSRLGLGWAWLGSKVVGRWGGRQAGPP